jgi:hypothetical protein
MKLPPAIVESYYWEEAVFGGTAENRVAMKRANKLSAL